MLKEIKVTLSGNVTRPPEVKNRKFDGRPFTVVAIAVNDRRYDQDKQQWVEEGTTYYDIVCRGSLGANVLASVDVGMPVVAHGKFRVHEWTTDSVRGARPGILADSLGIDLSWGTTVYTRGSRSYPSQDAYEVSPPPESEGGPREHYVDPETGIAYDEDGVVGDLPGAEPLEEAEPEPALAQSA